MDNLLNEIASILTVPPGNLTYHLVLAFSIAGALPAALNQRRGVRPSTNRRLLFGLSLLLIGRVIQFALAGAAWQGLVNGHILLPVVDRAVTLLSILLIFWLWAFPEPLRLADASTLLLALLALTVSILSYVWWSGQQDSSFFNGTFADVLGQGGASGFLLIGGLILAFRRPRGWGFGLSMLALLLTGHVLHLLLPEPESDFAGLVRLAQMAAFPLLLALPQRLDSPETYSVSAGAESLEKAHTAGTPTINPAILESILSLGTSASPQAISQGAVHAVAEIMRADICLLVSLPDELNEIQVLRGYDLIRQEPFEAPPLNREDAPLLADAFERGRTIKLQASSNATDLKALENVLNLKHTGPLVAAPIRTNTNDLFGALILLSPHANHSWTNDEQKQLETIAAALAQLLQRSEVQATLQAEIVQSHQTQEDTQLEIERLQNEIDDLKNRLQAEQEHHQQVREKAESLAKIVSAHEETEATIAQLQTELETLKSASAPQKGKSSKTTVPMATDDAQYAGELRLALEEIARLRGALAEVDAKQLDENDDQTAKATKAPAPESVEIAALVRELRGPMSSIMGYTDFVLGESVGILGALQRKFLLKVKMATQNLSTLVEELSRLTLPENNTTPRPVEEVNLNVVIDKAISQSSERLQAKNIALNLELPEQLPHVNTDLPTLQQILAGLLENAGSVTPEDGEVILRARVQAEDHEIDYILIQVVDQGGGIPPQDVPRIFSPPDAEAEPVPGVSANGAGMPKVKALVEQLGGRMWVDSQANAGATFSLLLPVSVPEPPTDNLVEGLLA